MADAFLEMHHIVKQYPGVRAVDDVSLTAERGEVRALMGENGAGKSTLIKILSGAIHPDSGEIRLNGQRADYHSPLQALRLGIGAIYQEFNLVPPLNVAQNILLGLTPTRFGSIDNRELHRRAAEVLQQLHMDIDTHLPINELDVAHQQIVEIAKGLARDLRVIIMDEPTAALNNLEVARLFELIGTLKARGVTVIYITHRMREIFEIADSVTVLKDGRLVDTRPIGDLTQDDIVSMMIGRQLKDYYPPKDTATDRVVFSARGLNMGQKLVNVDLDVRRGEVLGIAGLEGQGQRELVRALFGALPVVSGEFSRDGKRVHIQSPAEAIKHGIAYISDDRKGDGLVLIRSVNENISLPSLARRRWGGLFIDDSRERSFVNDMIRTLEIKVTGRSQLVNNLSGGNQQKIVVAKWLGTEPQVLIVAEPTRGIDVGSKSEIHHILRNLAREGVGIIMVSSELPEILGMSDRVLVMSEGRIVSELVGDAATEDAIMTAAAGSAASTVGAQ